ncbi:MAG TPA: LytTR family DNA-binding domain-containing protein [Bacteroidota bacterium]|nr:LytTR family DNA-binding domain-containing protein [Bacteroidota bacterium]
MAIAPLQRKDGSLRIRTLIVDDEQLARERLQILLKDDLDIHVIGECATGKDAVEVIRNESPDLVFLDVQMPEGNGFEVLESVDFHKMPIVVFVTAYDQYAIRAFDVHALDYLLKPFDHARFEKALVRAKSEVVLRNNTNVDQKLLSLLEHIESNKKHLDRILVKSSGRVFFLRFDEIDWIESSGNYVKLHVGSESHLLRETMTQMEQKLEAGKFVRIHRTTIVNIDRIKELQPWFNGDYIVLLLNGTKLTASRGYKKKLSEMFHEHT